MKTTSKDPTLFNDYEGFVEKFKPKKTTDDCYTPPAVYEAVKDWVDKHIMPLEGVRIVRPFYPGGDYEHAEYPEGCVVLDNPPFSMLAKICRFYNGRGIKYFLFAPGLTLFSAAPEESFVVIHHQPTYENGAKVNTGFRTNILGGDPRIIVAGSLSHAIEAADKASRAVINPPKIGHPLEVVTSAMLRRSAHYTDWTIPAAECHQIRKCDNHPEGRLFGDGFLISERAAMERAAMERAAMERAAMERAERERKHVSYGLSDRELEIVRGLGNADGNE